MAAAMVLHRRCPLSSIQASKSGAFGKIYGFYDVTDNFKLDFWAIGWFYLGAAFDFSSSIFELFLMASSVKIGYPITPTFEPTLL